MAFLTKLICAAITTTVITGGGVGLGLFSKQSGSLNANDVLKTASDKEPNSKTFLESSTSPENSQIDSSKNSISSSSSSSDFSTLLEPSSQVTLAPKAQESGGEPVVKVKETERGNCDIDDSMTKILQTKGQSEQEYYSVSCTNAGIDESEDLTFGDRWSGAFPKTLFKSQDLPASSKLEIKVKTDLTEDTGDVDYPYNIWFLSEQFKVERNSTINGIWNYDGLLDESNTTGAIVKLIGSVNEKNIYLLTRLDTDEK